MGERLSERSELPWVLIAIVVVLGGWYAVNRFALRIYPPDPSEGGRFHVLTYGSDFNPARADQLNKFNQYYRKDGVKVVLVPGGSDAGVVTTTSAARSACDIIEAYQPEVIRTYIDKGIALPLNEYLKANRIDLERITWPTRLDELRVPNPDWREGDPPLDRHTYYAVPNNLEATMVFFNRTLFDRVKEERERSGTSMPPAPWLHWTWWDYAAIAAALHRRGEDGRFVSFGGETAEVDLLYHQIGMSMRGEDRAAFERLSEDERTALGLGRLDWDDCVRQYRRDRDGNYTMYPNRLALAQAMQFNFDLVSVVHGAPSSSDVGQMAAGGSFNGNGGHGQFLAGVLGMHLTGRWFLGQVRGNAAFDWRLVRAPRWVPRAEWERWQRDAIPHERRDGPWGEIEHPLRGYAAPLGGRMACVSSSSRDPAKAFKFLEYLAANPDFNRILLVEDGMGADRAIALDYLGQPDPLFPQETVNRPSEHELGAIACLYAREQWPFSNFIQARDQLFWAELGPWYSDESLLSSGDAGRQLAERLTSRLDDGIAQGKDIDAPKGAAAPSWITMVVIAAAAVLASLVLRWKPHV